jgi:hypothetical protein
MVSPGSDEAFEKSLPASTAGSGEVAEVGEKPKRKYNKKPTTIDSESQSEVDPNMSDPRYARIVAGMSSLGGVEAIDIACKATGKPLDEKEKQKVDDTFYVLSKKTQFNPADSWIGLLIYCVILALQITLARTDIVERVKLLFLKAGEEVPQPEPQEPKDSIGE